MMKIAIIGSRNYTNKKNIQNFMFRLKMEHKDMKLLVVVPKTEQINMPRDLH